MPAHHACMLRTLAAPAFDACPRCHCPWPPPPRAGCCPWWLLHMAAARCRPSSNPETLLRLCRPAPRSPLAPKWRGRRRGFWFCLWRTSVGLDQSGRAVCVGCAWSGAGSGRAPHACRPRCARQVQVGPGAVSRAVRLCGQPTARGPTSSCPNCRRDDGRRRGPLSPAPYALWQPHVSVRCARSPGRAATAEGTPSALFVAGESGGRRGRGARWGVCCCPMLPCLRT